ncbi:MAG: DNA repair protein RecO, partial [Chitinophagaceae bacterium]|nr:DNA repair protein RecO [Chitinophagaceae bacterium]
VHLDEANEKVTANFTLFFALHLAVFFGFRINNEFSEQKNFLDLLEGTFSSYQPYHPHFLKGREAEVTSDILKVMQPEELQQIQLHHEFRRRLLSAYEDYYRLHIPNFGNMKTLPVLREIAG